MTTILSVAFPFAAMGDGAVGGAEQVLTSLERELVERGWRSIVVAHEASRPVGDLLPTAVPDGVITDEVRELVTRRHQAGIDRALASGSVDLVHLHGIDFASYRIPDEVPVLVTLHLPPGWYPEEIWSRIGAEKKNVRMVCVSEAQRRSCPAEVREGLGVVRNGVFVQAGSASGLRATCGDETAMKGAASGEDSTPKSAAPRNRSYALMLSRICPEKNVHAGLDAARQAGIDVVLAGETFPYEAHLRYFEERIRPRLGDGVTLVGAVGDVAKSRLLEGARCLLLPTLAPETSSLVAMEAAAAGTPVVAYRSGAVPEVVEDGVTGLLVGGVDEMADAIGRVGALDRERCRAVARERFSLDRMVEGYVALYREMLSGEVGG